MVLFLAATRYAFGEKSYREEKKRRHEPHGVQLEQEVRLDIDPRLNARR
jgi:hypothetical protein